MDLYRLSFLPVAATTQTNSSSEQIFSGILSFIANLKPQNAPLSSSNSSFGGGQKKNNMKSTLRFVALVVGAIAILFAGSKALSSMNFGTNANSTPSVKGALATNELNKEFSFPLKDAKGEEIGSIKYLVEKVELRDEIIVKGQRATAVSGRQFLILTVKVSNEFKQAIQINTRDYVRLSVNGNDAELLAPDIHNDPVEVQAISTKYTRLGFPINTTDKNLTLLIGEINSDEKERVELTF